jgi:ABC-2 type transport system permease protein/sodium transport system permease protein
MNATPPAVCTRTDSLYRLARLTLKELRETLRDRRTIVTLVLMPLLVYPLLSMAFKQFLVAGVGSTKPIEWRIGVQSDEDRRDLERILNASVRLDDPYLDTEDAGEKDETASPLDPSTPPKPALEQIKIGVFPEDLAEAVEHDIVHAGLVSRSREAPTSQRPAGRVQFDLLYRPDDAPSRELAEFLAAELRKYYEEELTRRLQRLGESGERAAQWRLRPITRETTGPGSLATLVPMILILMTITGAVYPAIDLTAGERERGTLEALMAAPVPRLGLLLAKYVAVLTVAILTALVNIAGMTATLIATGLGPVIFGPAGLAPGAVVAVFALLVLFAAFFAAVLLCVTSFARSFKEAQAYLIPLMMVSLAPGFVSLLPDLALNAWWSVVPLANMVLLARDVLAGQVHLLWGAVAVATTGLYAAAALALAARIFGSDSILYGSEGSWGDLFRRPDRLAPQASISGALACLALVVPLYVLLSGLLVQIASQGMTQQLVASSLMLLVLFALLPLAVARFQSVNLAAGFQITHASPWSLVGSLLIGCGAAPLAMALILLSQKFGISTFTTEQIAEKGPLVERLVAAWRGIPPAVVYLAIAVAPGICEELFFRGYLLGALRGRVPAWLAIGSTAVVFGLFHASVGGIIALERVLASMALGVVLGWVAWTTRSVIPGMVLHVTSNSLVVALALRGEWLHGLGWNLEGKDQIPPAWLAGAILLALVGALLVYLGRRTSPPVVSPAAPVVTPG